MNGTPDSPATPDLTGTVTSLVVTQAAAALGAVPDQLLDSHWFRTTVEGFDPGSPDFSKQVAEAIAHAVEQDPARFGAAPPAHSPAPETPGPSSAGGQGGDPGTPRQWTDDDLARATAAQTAEALDQGLLRNLGIAPKRSRRRS